jgi:transglutaminase-like putative cysteine protease
MTSSSRRFFFDYQVSIPPHDLDLDLWLPAPRTDPYQEVISTEIKSPVQLSRGEDPVHHNQILHGLLPTSKHPHDVMVRYEIERAVRRAAPPDARREATPQDEADLARFLAPDSRVPIEGPVVEGVVGVVSRDAPPRDRARQIFDNLLATLDYDSAGCTPERAHGLGDLAVACDIKRGTCTEFHGLFVAQARALGLPARFAFGFNIPRKPEGQIAGYHCWSEVFLPEVGWFAVDVSEAWKRSDPNERGFYFGNLDANRVQFTTGRDVSLVPLQRTGTVDRFIFPLAELAGRREDVDLKFCFADAQQRSEEQ